MANTMKERLLLSHTENFHTRKIRNNIDHPKMILRIYDILRGIKEFFANMVHKQEIIKLQEVLKKQDLAVTIS